MVILRDQVLQVEFASISNDKTKIIAVMVDEGYCCYDIVAMVLLSYGFAPFQRVLV